MSVFETDQKYSLNTKMFLDGNVSIARYDKLKYKQFDLLIDRQLSFFWRPEEVTLTKDAKDFRDLSSHEQHIFTSNLKRQILLDSVQGRGPLMLLPIISIPELESWVVTWAFSEQIHSRSYSHLIRNVYSDPSLVFDEITNIQEVVDCAKDVSKYYDELNYLIIAREATPMLFSGPVQYAPGVKEECEYNIKKALWMCLHSINALEGVRFYVSFACSWAFNELKKMEGNSKIIKLICRDENLHLASTQKLLDLLPTDDPDFVKIKAECKADCEKLFLDVVDQEKKWADYLFKDGSMIGLNADILKQYVEFIAAKRMKAVDLDCPFTRTTDPLPWTKKYIAGQDVQVAPQEVELSSYTTGEVTMDVDEDTFKDFTL